jgi:hypothetical protein
VVAEHRGEAVADGVPVSGEGAGVLAGADHQHLDEAALDLAVEVGVRPDAVHDDHAVRLGEVARGPHRTAEGALADGDHVHRRDDLGADALRGHAEVLEDGALACGRRAAVAAHAGRDEGGAAGLADGAGGGAQDRRQIADPPAAGGDGDACAGPDGVAQTGAFQPLGDGLGDADGDARRVELVHELQKGAVVPQTNLSDTADRIAVEPTTSPHNPKEAQACTVPNAATTPAAPSSALSAARTWPA